MSNVVHVPLELEAPAFRCTDCGFTTRLQGQWSTRNGRLTFVANEEPQTRRGPDLHGCWEGWNVAYWTHIESSDTDQKLDLKALLG